MSERESLAATVVREFAVTAAANTPRYCHFLCSKNNDRVHETNAIGIILLVGDQEQMKNKRKFSVSRACVQSVITDWIINLLEGRMWKKEGQTSDNLTRECIYSN